MEFNTKKVQAMGKSVAEEIKRCGFGSGDTLFDVENAMRGIVIHDRRARCAPAATATVAPRR